MLEFSALPSGPGILYYIPGGNCVNQLLVRTPDGSYTNLSYNSHSIPCTDSFSEIGKRSDIIIDGDKFFTHIDGKLDVSFPAYKQQLQSKRYDNPYNPSESYSRYWIVGAESNSIPIYDSGYWEWSSSGVKHIVYRSDVSYSHETYMNGSLYNIKTERIERVDSVTNRIIGTDLRNGNYEYTSTARTVAYVTYRDIPSWNSASLKRTYDNAFEHLYLKAKSLGKFVPDAAHWKASLDAADGVMAYDLNMVEALLGFGLDDLIPKGLAENSLRLLDEAAYYGDFISYFCALMRISGAMYLSNKYVTGNNVQDICEITGWSDDLSDHIQKAKDSFQADGVDETAINQKLYTVARKIAQGKDYFSSTYGTYKEPIYDPECNTSYRTIARLRAFPGPYADVSTLGIIVDEFGLKARASRLVEAAPYEFIANWFLPIEDFVHNIEYNEAHLNVLYDVVSLTLSDNIEMRLKDSFKYLHGLSEASVSGYIRFYDRSVSDEFPPTVLSFSADSGGINGSRILQGGSLIISSN